MSSSAELQRETQLEHIPRDGLQSGAQKDASNVTNCSEIQHVEGFALFLVMTGLITCLFLPALDQLILSTAIPQIVSQFDSLGEISWIPNAYFLTMASFMILYGQILNLAPIKHVIFVCVFIFELGSLLCGLSSNMNFLLLGRSVAGVGAAGLSVCIYAAVAQVAPLDKRAMLMGLGSTTYGLSSVIGPLMGGILTDKLSWRWCFYINLPIGGIAAIVVFFFLPNYPAPPKPPNRRGWRGLLGVDYLGCLLVIAMNITFLYPLVEGGNSYPWNSPIIIFSFVTSGILLIVFVIWSWYRGRDAILPLYLLKNRSIIGASLSNFLIRISFILGSVFIATWYQAVKGDGPIKSGIDLLPFSLVTTGVSAVAGVVVGKTGRYWHILVLVPLIGSVAAGLLYTITENTSKVQLIGFQTLWAVSIGATMMQPTIAGQAEYQDNLRDTRFATSLITFTGFIGRMVGLGMGSALFINKLAKNLKSFAPDAPAIVLESVDAIWKLPVEERTEVIHAYVLSLRYIFILGVPAGGLATLAALLMRDHRLERTKKPISEDKQAAEETQTTDSEVTAV